MHVYVSSDKITCNGLRIFVITSHEDNDDCSYHHNNTRQNEIKRSAVFTGHSAYTAVRCAYKFLRWMHTSTVEIDFPNDLFDYLTTCVLISVMCILHYRVLITCTCIIANGWSYTVIISPCPLIVNPKNFATKYNHMLEDYFSSTGHYR